MQRVYKDGIDHGDDNINARVGQGRNKKVSMEEEMIIWICMGK